MRLIAGTELDALDAAQRSLRHADEITEGLLAEPVRLVTLAQEAVDEDAEETYEDGLRRALSLVDDARSETIEWLDFAATMHVVGRWRTSNDTYEAVTGACRSAVGNLDDWHDWADAELRDLD